MAQDAAVVTTRRIHFPLHPLPTSWAAFCFLGCLITDLTYWKTAEMMWADFSAWFVSVGCVLAVLALVAAVFDAATGRLVAARSRGWLVVFGYLVVLILAVLNAMVHTRDAWTSVVPWGIGLSVATAVVILCIWGVARADWAQRVQEKAAVR